MNLVYYGCSECGKVREKNEDAIFLDSHNEHGLFIVSDGVGGKANGDVASKLICEGYACWWKKNINKLDKAIFQNVIESLKNFLVHLNTVLVDHYGSMAVGSTIALMFISGGRCVYLSAGDSRIYKISGLSFRQMTVDDIYENYHESTQEFDAKSAGKLTSAVGIRKDIEFSLRTDFVKSGDRFFLCTDGVYKYISPTLLRLKLTMGADEKAISAISDEVDKRGAKDNYSMILVNIK